MSSSKKKKIMYVTTTLQSGWGGGEPIVAKNTIRMLQKSGYNVFVTYYKSIFGITFTKLIGLIRSIFWISDSVPLSYKYYKKVMIKENPDIIISQYDYDSSIIQAANNLNKQIIVYVHIWWPICPKITLFNQNNRICTGYYNNDCKICITDSVEIKSILNATYKKMVEYLNRDQYIHKKMDNRINFLNLPNVTIIVLTQSMKDTLVKQGIHAHKIEIIQNGINCKEFYHKVQKEKIVGYYGGENPVKGYKVFFELAKIIKPLHPEIKFVATGNFQKQSEYIEFMGNLERNDFMHLIGRSMCTVIPSLWNEPFNLVAIESMASGSPVVAFDVGSLKNIIIDGETGFIVPKDSIDDMVKSILKILMDENLFLKLSSNSRKYVCEKFTEEGRIDSLINIIS